MEELLKVVVEKISIGEELIKRLECVKHIEGVMKLQRKIRQENEFLKRLLKAKKVKEEQLSCSNLRHLGAMVDCAMRPGVIAVCKVFHINNDSKLLVDVVSDQGMTWNKVVARNPKSLSAQSAGKASYGARSIVDQAKDYMKCAKLYPCMYKPPTVVFEFASGIEERLAKKLKYLGVIVKGDVVPSSNYEDDISNSDSENDTYSSDSEEEISQSCQNDLYQQIAECISNPELTTLNLDVTTMMVCVSNMTNGHCNFVFQQEVLTQQCEWEVLRPVKPIIDKLFEGKKLVCCRTAWDDFEKIVNNLGGPHEKQRTEELKSKLTILPDDFGGEDDYPRKNLKVRGHVRLRSKIIFNFGHRIKALTVSANEGFVRAALQQGVTYAAFIHESRALTEGKESSAKEIQCSS